MNYYINAGDKASKARELFNKGYNCAQAVAIAFSDILGIAEDDVARLVSGFGGGFGRMREVCGAVSGGVFVLNTLFGGYNVSDTSAKAEHYSLIQEFMKSFEAENGSYICRELLGIGVRNETPIPEARTEQYYKKRPCGELCEISARITASLILNKI